MKNQYIYNKFFTHSIICFVLIKSLCSLTFAQGVCISKLQSTTPHHSAILELQSDNSGFLIPRLTTIERDAISTPAHALMIFNTTTKCIEIWTESWNQLWCNQDTVPFTCNPNDSVTFSYNGANVTYGVVVGQNNTCWLDRNLGASRVALSYDDSDAYGDLFQLGRLIDGHQFRTSATTPILSVGDVPGHANFITNTLTHTWKQDPQSGYLWQGDGSINDPCPNGWRVPTKIEYENELNSWNSIDFNGAFQSPLKLTANGRRNNNGELFGVNTIGRYWTSTFISIDVDNDGAYSLGFTINSASTSSTLFSVIGMAVRCIRSY